MFTTIRSKLLVIFLLFVFVTIGVSVITFNYFEKSKASLSKITEIAESSHVLLLKDIKIIHEFFENETINPGYFETQKSILIDQHEKLCEALEKSLEDLNRAQNKNNFKLTDTIKNIKAEFSNYKSLTSQIISQILKRGFKDYGVEGKMRGYAHDLEKYSGEIGLVSILQLRRHEKDFIIRQEDPYITKHRNLINEIKDKLSLDHHVDRLVKSRIIKTLNSYSEEFNTLVDFEKKLGLKNGQGLKREIDTISNKIESNLSSLVLFSQIKESSALLNIKITYLVIGLVFALIGIFAAMIISRRVSKSITDLKEKIDEFVKSDFTIRTVPKITDSENEIDVLTTNFGVMEEHIVNQMNSLKQSNKDLEMLFYVTSHDIRPPLLRVKELTSHAFVKAKDDEMKESLFQINQAWEKLLIITDELGIVTNVRSVEIKTETVDLEKLLHSVFSEFRALPLFDTIIFSIDLKVKYKLYSSPGLLKAIFRNLIENSVKYAIKRDSFSFLKITIADQNEEMLRIEVIDNGAGIKKEYQSRVFDMFFRGNKNTDGTGLGLYIVKCALEKLNGAISLESVENVGTTFTLLLPNNYKRKNIKERILHNRIITGLGDNINTNTLV